MLKRNLSVVLVIALGCTVGKASSVASALSDPEVKPQTVEIHKGPNTPPAKSTEKLRARMLELIADTKAGKAAPAKHPQTKLVTSNNLSKRTKIAIGVGIALGVVAIILIVNKPRLTGATFQ